MFNQERPSDLEAKLRAAAQVEEVQVPLGFGPRSLGKSEIHHADINAGQIGQITDSFADQFRDMMTEKVAGFRKFEADCDAVDG